MTFAVADDLAVMRAGRVVQTGPIAQVWGAPVDADTAALVDSWDRRIRDRVHHPVVRRTPEWPATGLIVVDARTGDLLAVLREGDAARPGGEGMPAA